MENKKSAVVGLCLLLVSTTSIAALTDLEKGYVSRLNSGGYISIRSAAQDMVNNGTTNTEVLDVAAQVLLDRYPRAGEGHDAVDALAWVCRALGQSGNSRYRPVLEKVEKDETAHRKLRGHCEKGADSLPKQVTNAYVPGSVNAAPATAGAAATTTSAAAGTASAAAPADTPNGAMGFTNPAPAHKLQGYAGYELKPLTLSDEAKSKKNVDKVAAKIEEGLQQSVTPILAEWNAAAAGAPSKDRLVIEPHVVGVHKPSGANRFWAGAFAGNGYIVMKVKISEQSSGKVIAEPQFYRRANAMAGAWTFGAHDNAMLQKVGSLLANYLSENYTQAKGGETGFEP
jgi:hypothetical protein